MNLPKDPMILLSVVNARLRDHHPDLGDFCASHGVEERWLCGVLREIGYEYNRKVNQFQ